MNRGIRDKADHQIIFRIDRRTDRLSGFLRKIRNLEISAIQGQNTDRSLFRSRFFKGGRMIPEDIIPVLIGYPYTADPDIIFPDLFERLPFFKSS